MRLITALSLAAVMAATPALAGNACLDITQATTMKFVSERTMIVNTRTHRAFTVTFRNACAVSRFPNTHFVYETWTVQPCLHRGDVLPTNDLGACFVDTVVTGHAG